MAATTGRYFFYDFTSAVIQKSDGAGTPAIVSTSLLYPNKITPNSNEVDILFEGGGQRRHVYLNNEFSVEIDQDCLDAASLSAIFGKNKSTTLTGTPFATEYTPYGDTTEGSGVSVGGVFTCPAVKNVSGVETVVNLILWVPVATLTLVKNIGMNTGAKGDMPKYKLSAVRSTINIIGGAISGAPSGGAFCYIGE